MKKLILTILFIPILAFGQSKSYFELKGEAKTKKSADEIEKLIVGIWEFQKLTDSTGKTIMETTHTLNDTTTEMIVCLPSMRIEKNGSFQLIDCENPRDFESGKWKYDRRLKLFRMTFDKLTPEHLKKLKESNLNPLASLRTKEIEFSKITETELKVFAHLPTDGTEFKYNLLIYRKK
ncbi:hypothetical protein [Mariniflexile sp.]|uniref:hypothetical protein n=1 Tax=Mariniflexile sp. TaxID=1979402 RepID=UPI004048E8E5